LAEEKKAKITRRQYLKYGAAAAVVVAAGAAGAAYYLSPPQPTPGPTSTATATATGVPTVTQPTSGVKLKVQTLTGVNSQMIVDEIKYWNEHYGESTGITLEPEILSFQGYFDKVTAQMIGGAKEPDLWFVWSYYTGAFAPYAVDLNTYLKDPKLFSSPDGKPYNRDDLYPNAYDSGDYKGKQVMLPQSMGFITTIYRTDLIQKPPDTWDELLEIARKFTKSKNPNSPTTYGLALCGRGPIDTTSWKTWLTAYWSYGGNYFKKDTFEPDFNNEAGLKASRIWATMAKEELVPPEVTTFAFMETMSALQSGQIAMILDWQTVYNTLVDKEKSPKVFDKVAWTVPPGVKQADGSIKRHSYMGGNEYLINVNSLHKEEAFKFLAWYLYGEGMELDVTLKGNTPMNRRAYEDPQFSNVPVIKRASEVGIVPIARVEPAYADMPTIQSIGSGALSGLLAGASPEKTLEIIQNESAKYLKSKGYF